MNITIAPMDVHNQGLLANVHPSDWVNPDPASLYDLVVIGAGTAGLVTAARAAGLGAKVALVEKHLMGGDSLNVGCVPSKSLIRSARAYAAVEDARRFGIHVPQGTEANFPTVMQQLREIRALISHNDSATQFRQLGVDVFFGQGCFGEDHTVEVARKTLRFKKAVIATGARAVQPAIPGLKEAKYLTNETVFNLTQRPRRLAVIGGGPIGCELAQALSRLGSEVVILHKHAHLLPKEDLDAAEIIQQQFIQEKIGLHLNCEIIRVESSGSEKVIYYRNDTENSVVVDEILAATGRMPNVENLNLEEVGVDYDRSGIVVNDYLQTTNPRIYAAGDVCMDLKFTHAADAAASIVIKNTLLSPFGVGRDKLSNLVIPWTTYTSPEVARVGLNEEQAKEQKIDITTIMVAMSGVDRAIADGETAGFVKIHLRRGSDEILGATIVAEHAGEMINEITLAMVAKVGLGKLANVIHPYPTQAQAIKKAADAYRRTFLAPSNQGFLRFLLKIS